MSFLSRTITTRIFTEWISAEPANAASRSLSAPDTIDVAAYGLRDYVCWSPLRAASACAVPEGVLPHIEYPDAPPSLAMDNISVIASTGTM
jgi:hypothetical protein